MQMKQPAIFVSHGAGPCFWVNLAPIFEPHSFDTLRVYFSGLLASLPTRPDAIVVISAHWENILPTVSINPSPPMLYDYFGFPAQAYELNYPAAGSPSLGRQIIDLLQTTGIDASTDSSRGFDHGVFVPLLIIDPVAGIPVVMLSLHNTLDAKEHIAMGQAIQSIREQNVLILGSGSSFHNLKTITSPERSVVALEFDDWLGDVIETPDPSLRNHALQEWGAAPHAHLCHPRAEHLMPLMVVAGAAGEDLGRRTLRTSLGGNAISCFSFGS